MRQCPKCGRWSMDFDDYFGRFRCLACGWMAPSTTDLELRALQSQPQQLESVHIPGLGLTLTPSYDADNDVISIDFGLNEPTIDLPEPDGMMIWRIGRHSDRVAGFAIVGAKEGPLSRIGIQFIMRRKKAIETRLPMFPAFAGRRVTRDVVEEVIVTAVSQSIEAFETDTPVEVAWRDIVNELSRLATTCPSQVGCAIACTPPVCFRP